MTQPDILTALDGSRSAVSAEFTRLNDALSAAQTDLTAANDAKNGLQAQLDQARADYSALQLSIPTDWSLLASGRRSAMPRCSASRNWKLSSPRFAPICRTLLPPNNSPPPPNPPPQ